MTVEEKIDRAKELEAEAEELRREARSQCEHLDCSPTRTNLDHADEYGHGAKFYRVCLTCFSILE